jgi:hypothetical protein
VKNFSGVLMTQIAYFGYITTYETYYSVVFHNYKEQYNNYIIVGLQVTRSETIYQYHQYFVDGPL